MKHKTKVCADAAQFEEILERCREKFGHRGKQSGWWWDVKGKWRNQEFIFSFEREEDLLVFKLIKG